MSTTFLVFMSSPAKSNPSFLTLKHFVRKFQSCTLDISGKQKKSDADKQPIYLFTSAEKCFEHHSQVLGLHAKQNLPTPSQSILGISLSISHILPLMSKLPLESWTPFCLIIKKPWTTSVSQHAPVLQGEAKTLRTNTLKGQSHFTAVSFLTVSPVCRLHLFSPFCAFKKISHAAAAD